MRFPATPTRHAFSMGHLVNWACLVSRTIPVSTATRWRRARSLASTSPALQFWDANGLTNPPAGERIEIADQSSAVVADGSSTNVSGFNFGQAGPTGTLHRHIQFWVQHPDFDANDPFTNPISVGAFIIPLEITSTAHATSDTFYLMFNSGLAAPVFEERRRGGSAFLRSLRRRSE